VHGVPGGATLRLFELQMGLDDVSRMRCHGSQAARSQATWKYQQWMRVIGIQQAV